MFIAMNRFKVIRGAEADFEAVWIQRDTQLRDVPGFCPSICFVAPSARTMRFIRRIHAGAAGQISRRGRDRRHSGLRTAMPAPIARFTWVIPNSRASR